MMKKKIQNSTEAFEELKFRTKVKPIQPKKRTHKTPRQLLNEALRTLDGEQIQGDSETT